MPDKTGRFSLKVPHGKLVAARVTFGESVRKVELTGDFFIYPEDGITVMESALVGLSASASEVEMAAAVQSAMDANGIQAVGVDAQSIARVVRGAMK